jgi:hypothetical protein
MTAWQPIIVHLPMAGRQTIQGPYAALMALLIDWPEKRSAYYRAVELCTLALDDENLKERARKEFQNAAIQASVGPLKNTRVLRPSSHPDYRSWQGHL